MALVTVAQAGRGAVEAEFRSERRIPGPDDPPRTNYEAKYREEGRPIYEIRFWKEGYRSSNLRVFESSR